MYINIPVKESSFDVIVRHISSMTSFPFIVELVFYFSEKGKRMMFLPLLYPGTCDMYVFKRIWDNLTSVCRQI